MEVMYWDLASLFLLLLSWRDGEGWRPHRSGLSMAAEHTYDTHTVYGGRGEEEEEEEEKEKEEEEEEENSLQVVVTVVVLLLLLVVVT